DAMQQIAEQGRERLAQGFWIVVYPEGTRIRAGTRAHYKTGGARLALALGIPVVPVAHNAGYLWPKGVLGKRPGTVTVSIGKPIDHSGLVVRAPRWVPIREIELALTERARWVIETLAIWRGRNRESLPTEWHAGAPLLYLGRPLTLALFPARRTAIAADLLH